MTNINHENAVVSMPEENLPLKEETKKDKQAAIWLFVASLVFYLLISQGDVTSQGYDGENFYTAQKIVEKGQVSIAGTNPPVYARNGIMQPLLMVPWYEVTKLAKPLIPNGFPKEWLAAWFNPFLTALTILFIYLFILELDFTRQKAVVIAVLAAFTSMLVPYSQIGLETLQTLTALMAAYYLYRFKLKGSWPDLIWAGLSAGVLFGSKRLAVPFVLVLTGYLLYILLLRFNLKNKNFWLAGAIWVWPIVVSYGLLAWFNSIRPPTESDLSKFFILFEPRLIGLHSYLFSLNKSIFLYSPTIILGVIGYPGFWRKFKPEAVLFGVIALFAFALPTFSVAYGDEVWGPRYIHIIIPFGYIVAVGVLPTGVIWARWRRWSVISLSLFGALVQFLGSLYWYGRYVEIQINAGTSSLLNYGEVAQTSQLLIHFEMFFSSITARLFNYALRLNYRVIFWPPPANLPKVTRITTDFVQLDMQQPLLTRYAKIAQWGHNIVVLPDQYLPAKIAAIVVSLIMISLLIFALLKLRRFWSQPE